jgi:phosphoribosylformylglycinamidine synthase subunit PurL
MTPYEMMLSESQERMLLILKSGQEEKAEKIFKKWDLDFSLIGKTTNTKKLVLNMYKKQVASIPLSALSKDAPVYDRKWKKTKQVKNVSFPKSFEKLVLLESLKKILQSPNNSEKKWVWEQYDHTVMGDTIQKPGGDAGVIRIHNQKKAIAVTVDSSANYCQSNPLTGSKQVVCEVWRNLISVGSKPIAITNCLNFGNPEKESIMGQFVETIDGISQACKYLDFPVVSGNVSFYNETNNKGIAPTPTVGGVGLIKNIDNMISKNLKEIDNLLIVVGKTSGHLYQSELFREVLNFNEGPPPEVNLFNEKNNGLSIQELVLKKLIKSIHDISSGGMLHALSEMCIAGKIGAKIKIPNDKISKHEYLFAEDQSRYLIEISAKNKDEVTKILEKNSVYFEIIGITQKDKLDLDNEFTIKISELDKLSTSWFKNYYKEN